MREELKQRRHEGDAVYFGDVYGYEASSVEVEMGNMLMHGSMQDCGQRWDLKLQLSNEDHLVGDSASGFTMLSG